MYNIIKFINKPERLVYIKIIIVAIFWGGNYVFGKIASQYLSPSVYGLTRFFFASVALLTICNYRKEFKFLQKKEFYYIILLSLFGCVGVNITMQLGLNSISATRGSLLATSTPVFVCIGALIFFKEKLNGIQIIGIILSILGTLFVVTNGNFTSIMTKLSIGDMYVILSILCWVVYVLLGKVFTLKVSPLLMTTWVAIITSIIFSPLALYEIINAENNFNLKAIMACFYAGFFGTCVAYVWFLDSVKIIGAARASVFMNLEAFFAIIMASILLQESISMYMALGGIITILGVSLTNMENIKIYNFFRKK